MQLFKREDDWSDMILTFNGHLDSSGEIQPSNVNTMIRLGIDTVANIYDQLLAVGNTSAQQVTLTIKQNKYTFGRKMAIALMLTVEEAWFQYEIGDTADFLPEEEWTEEYLLSL